MHRMVIASALIVLLAVVLGAATGVFCLLFRRDK
jgi:hypothetical protein